MLGKAIDKYGLARVTEPRVQQYLASRGIDTATANTFRLGYVDEPAAGHARFAGRLAIPYIGADGRILHIKFRCLEEHNCKENGHSKYDQPPGPARLFNIPAIHRPGHTLHITEGELDAVILNKIGLAAIGGPGATSWKYHFTRCVAGFSKVWVWGDGDEAGSEFVQTICKAVRQAEGVNVPKGMDATEIFKRGGAEALLALINNKEDNN